MQTTVILRDAQRQQWLYFNNPLEVIAAQRIEDVLPALQAVEQSVERHGHWAAGFIGYEAAPAFDPALRAHTPSGHFPPPFSLRDVCP